MSHTVTLNLPLRSLFPRQH